MKMKQNLTIGALNFFIKNSDERNTFFEFAVDDFEKAKGLLLVQGCIISKEYHDKSVMITDPYALIFHLFEGRK